MSTRSDSEVPARSGLRFLVTAALLSIGLFGLLRLPQIESTILMPFTRAQYTLACRIGGDPEAPISVGLSCSAADVIALCLGFVASFPVVWWKRVGGAVLGLLVIACINTIRIATLSHAVGSRQWFDALHLYLWPGALILAVSLYVFAWMSWASRSAASGPLRSRGARRPVQLPRGIRFVLTTAVLVIVFVGSSRWWMDSDAILAAAQWVAATGAFVIGVFGGEAVVTGNLMRTPYGSWVVTQECIMTPLMPAYLAAALTLRLSRRQRVVALLAAGPLFFLLGAARLVVLALPSKIIGSHFVAIHGFYQILLAFVAVALVAFWAEREPRAPQIIARKTLIALVLGLTVSGMVAASYNRLLLLGVERATELWGHAGHIYTDPQGALSLMAPYQAGLAAALWFAWHRSLPWRTALQGLVVFLVSQPLVHLGIGEWVAHTGVEPHLALIRALSVGIVLLIGAWLWRKESISSSTGSLPPTRPNPGKHSLAKKLPAREDVGSQEDPREVKSYKGFWDTVGGSFPDLGAARSTALYRRDEERLLSQHLAPLDKKSLLKSDLWDEAKNTRILQWAADQGARCHGIDISLPIVRQSRRDFGGRRLRAQLADLRQLPYRDRSFDAIYSMGTVEHFDETERALAEMFRVLKPGGRGLIGVPNRWDPFLRPVMVAFLYRLGLYGYGFEKSYSRRRFRGMLEEVGFEVVAEDGILFIPGWLRILDLCCHLWWPPGARVTGYLTALFGGLTRRFPRLNRHGYLIAAVAVRPER